ncbi:hypothetical protein GCM10010503_68540 [Streptomyces lucensis JCM 4490]|uniref:Uncharacterized protein n=1 Tax=Streptomyces lucensis JCM 4490 TaxID=1306176 RepID=A0A918JI94_9ACTN|nr:hypothetical protein [Streptomyces lucensis]GGW81464.1 hypothetical protein GCM10010503_68540 [Streptomyces lucensis JCM 4490]
MGDGGRSDLRRGVEVLSQFKNDVDKALRKFEQSPGSSSKLADHALSRASFSGSQVPFSEAQDLHLQYEHVHERLMHLSKTLALQIEAMTLAAHSADATYDGSEDEVRRRFWKIKNHLDDEYAKATDKNKHHDEQPRKDTRQHTDHKSAGVSSN